MPEPANSAAKKGSEKTVIRTKQSFVYICMSDLNYNKFLRVYIKGCAQTELLFEMQFKKSIFNCS